MLCSENGDIAGNGAPGLSVASGAGIVSTGRPG
jgi:hypothetical protein